MDPKIFGRYQIIRKLAGGGMGRVFLAYDPVLNRHVGLKLIDAGGDQDSLDVIAAERRGAILQDQLAKREQGGRVAQIFDVGERDGYFYIAMEYIEGEDLSELVARGPLDPERAVGIALDVLDVLVKAHHFKTVVEDRPHSGIIHGDIKPRNIRITPAGHVKVLDFGIAKAVSMTRSITFNQFGSIPYASPERLQTGDMDARSDVWSVGIVLFEMLTGRRYFEAEGTKLEWMIRNYRALQPALVSLPTGLREIVARALDPDLNHRYISAAAFETSLHDWKRQTADPGATRRTAYSDQDEHTRRSVAPVVLPRVPVWQGSFGLRWPGPAALPAISRWIAERKFLKPLYGAATATMVLFFLAAVFTVVYEIRMFGNAENLRRQIDSGQLGLDAGNNAYHQLVKRSLLSFPLYPARRSLRDHYTAEADRVIADYREASESTPVYLRDWRRAQSALASALALDPEDKSIRGRYSLIDGHLKLRVNNFKDARSDFVDARNLLPRSPDPHLGLAMIYMGEGELDKAQDELNQARRNGFQPGRREQRALADGYRLRGEKWLAGARRTHDIGQMQEALKRADNDLAHAQELYTAVAPLYHGVEMAEKVSLERDKAAKTLAEARQIQQDPPKETP
jgi:tetratricopeptide (TPR) repeat protein